METYVANYVNATINQHDVGSCSIPKIIKWKIYLKKFSINLLKSDILKNLKSSTRFGETSIFSKNLSVFSKNLKLILKERRFLYFTKKGPIEVVFNIKHYLSAIAIFLVLIFKVFQLLFFGVSSFFSYMVYKNTVINEQSFTESEIKALKSIAKGKNISEQEINSEKAEIVIKQQEEFNESIIFKMNYKIN